MLACCASRRFAAGVADGRPYASADAVEAAVRDVFSSLTWDDVLEAMDGHPRIGARAGGASAVEQAGVGDAARAAFASANAEYEARFGFVFLICASGMSGARMLAALRERLKNDLDSERRVATAELLAITVLRARKAVGG
jgi:2-oxo-4-hydroxy-4-carboxy-5-ureidoimidazoline decarboxylase